MHFLITGASGFVGNSLCHALIEREDKVTGVTRSAKALEGIDTYSIQDWKNQSEWQKLLNGVDVVVHLAARVHVMHDRSRDPLAAFREANYENTKALAESVLKSAVKKFIFLSTILVNGTETSRKSFQEGDAPAPQDPYSVSKLETEKLLEEIFAGSSIELVIIRPPLIYGPGCRGNFLRLMSAAKKIPLLPLGSFKNKRSMIYVGNLVDFIQKVAVTPTKKNLYLISDGVDLSLGDLVRKIVDYGHGSSRVVFFPKWIIKAFLVSLGREEEFHKIASDLIIDSSAAQADLGWTPKYSVDEGLKTTLEWYSQPP